MEPGESKGGGTGRILLAFLNYNTSEELAAALQTVPGACQGMDCETVILDNASPKEGERERLEKIRGEASLLLLPENLGFAGAFNHVLPPMLDGYDYVLLLNTDILLPENFVRDLVAAAEQLPDLGLAGVRLVREDSSPQFCYGPVPTLASELVNRSLFQKRYAAAHRPAGRPLAVESVLGAVMLVKTAAAQAAGPMDPGFFFFFEETEWCCRMRDKGFAVYHIPTVTATHFQGRAANRTPLRARIEFHRSRRRFFRLRSGLAALWVLTAGTFLRLIVNLLAQAVMTVLTLGRRERYRAKAALYFGLLKWYAAGCPEGAGLDRRGLHA